MSRIESVVRIDAGAERVESHGSAVSAMHKESGVVALCVDGDAETFLDLIKREDVGDGMGAVPDLAKVLDISHLCGRVGTAVGGDHMGVCTRPNIREERSVAEDVRGGTGVKKDPSFGKGDNGLGEGKVATKMIGWIGQLGEFERGAWSTVGGRGSGRRSPTCWRRRGTLVVTAGRIAVFGILGWFRGTRRLVVDEHLICVGDGRGVLIGTTTELVAEV